MKAEHRKELHTNLLADRLTKLAKNLKSGPSSSSLAIWIGIGLLVLTYIVWRVYSRSATETRAALWSSMNAALQDDAGLQGKLSELAKDNPRTIPGRVARLQLARRHLQDGVRQLPVEPFRKEAVAKLIQARDEFAQLASETAGDSLLGAEALMGQARAEEALASVPNPDDASKPLGDLDKAQKAYEQVVAKYRDSAEVAIAKERLKIYENKDQRRGLEQFYARLREEFGKKSSASSIGD